MYDCVLCQYTEETMNTKQNVSVSDQLHNLFSIVVGCIRDNSGGSECIVKYSVLGRIV